MAKKEEYGTTVELIGGNNEYRIGANSFFIEHKEKNKETRRIMLDVGAMFPPDWVHYDSLIPDFSKYFENPYDKVTEPIDAMFITHCHEDHIGALVYLAAAKYKLPKIYTGDYTKKQILLQMSKYNIPNEYIPEIETVRHDQEIEIADNIKVSACSVSHSTKDPLAFLVETKINGKFNAGNFFLGDYHTGKVPFGQGYDKKDFTKFCSKHQITAVYMDATSASMDEQTVSTYKEAWQDSVRELKKYPEHQVFSAVIARSVQNLAVELRTAKELGRTVLIASPGLRDSYNSLKEGLKQNDPQILEWFGIKEDEEFDIDNLVKVAYNSADEEKYLKMYDHSQRYVIISGAMDEEKNARKSRLRLMSEQNKVTYDANGKMKGKGLSGDPVFTIDSKTLIKRSQRWIPSISGNRYPETNARFKAMGAEVIEVFVRTGHAKGFETQEVRDIILNYAVNHEDFLSGRSKLCIIGIHGDPEQIKTLSRVVESPHVETIECKNSDKIRIYKGDLEKIEGLPFDDQVWIAVEKHALSGHGVDNVFIFDLVDKNFTKIDNLLTVINIQTSANPHAKKENNFNLSRALAEAEKLEEQGMSMTNIAIRNQIRGDRRGRITEDYSYSQIKALREEKSKSKQKKRYSRKSRANKTSLTGTRRNKERGDR